MEWSVIASIIFSCVTANHLGLVKAFEEVFERELPIINCVKCFTFWSVLIYSVIVTHDYIMSLAISFLASYVGIWLELLEGYIDTLYLKLYGKIIAKHCDNEVASDADNGYPESALS